MIESCVVLKFGSSVLRSPEDLPWAVQEIYAHVRRGERVVAVVSAFDGITDMLYAKARGHGSCERATAALVATGEFESAALLALTLDRCGVPATLLEPRAVALETTGRLLDAEPAAVDTAPFEAALGAGRVVVFPGFSGVDASGATALLGRGGSDLTALFLAERLGASCVLVKDVDGLYERDPALPGPPPGRYTKVSWEDALRVGGKVVQPKTLRAARLHGRALTVRAIGAPTSTVVCAGPSELEEARPLAPTRVALLGLGTVGGGVYERLKARPDLFEVTAILVRDPAPHVARGLPAGLLQSSLDATLATVPEVVVEALGGTEPAGAWLLASLEAGCRVVSANKAALAARFAEFAPHLGTAALRGSAAVGGAVPMLEGLGRLVQAAPVTRLRGVVNGTCNYVLDRLEAGVGLAEAIAEAQQAGYAEPDPGFDLGGLDAAAKLRLLACTTGLRIAPGFPVAGLDEQTVLRVAAAQAAGSRLRLVAEWTPETASVGLVELGSGDWLAAAAGEENRLEITLADGRLERLHGRGAGRAPTATAVVADLLDVREALAQAQRAGALPAAALSPRRAASA